MIKLGKNWRDIADHFGHLDALLHTENLETTYLVAPTSDSNGVSYLQSHSALCCSDSVG